MNVAKRNGEVSWWPLGAIAVLAVVLWFCWGYVIWHLSLNFASEGGRIAAAGQLGDLFGGINALFSGLAFAALIFTVHLQRKELSLQRRELEETRNVFEKQEAQMQQQNNTLRKQTFDATFFQWINLHHGIVGALKYGEHGGRKVLAQIRNTFLAYYLQSYRQQINRSEYGDEASADETKKFASRCFSENSQNDKEILIRAYEKTHAQYDNELVHYHQNLYEILVFLVSNQSENDQRFYINIVKAQLSSAELLLLLGFGLTKDGKAFATLIEQWGLLSNLTNGQFFIPEHRSFYPECAYEMRSKVCAM